MAVTTVATFKGNSAPSRFADVPVAVMVTLVAVRDRCNAGGTDVMPACTAAAVRSKKGRQRCFMERMAGGGDVQS